MRPPLSVIAGLRQVAAPRDVVSTAAPFKPMVSNQEGQYKQFLMEEMNKNKDKNFVQRILSPDKYPTLPLSNGKQATHLMSWGESDGQYFVFPTVIQDPSTKKLIHLEDEEAFNYAMKNKEYLQFKDALSAAMISKNYKKLWNK